jgi:hypothetical protein
LFKRISCTYQETTEGKIVRRHNPLLSTSWYIECFTDGRQNDDRSLNRHCLFATYQLFRLLAVGRRYQRLTLKNGAAATVATSATVLAFENGSPGSEALVCVLTTSVPSLPTCTSAPFSTSSTSLSFVIISSGFLNPSSIFTDKRRRDTKNRCESSFALAYPMGALRAFEGSDAADRCRSRYRQGVKALAAMIIAIIPRVMELTASYKSLDRIREV